MEKNTPHQFFRHPLFWVLQAMLAMGYIVGSHGIGLTHDSAMYVFAARKLHETGSLVDPSGNAMVLYPPLYSFFLAIGEFLNFPVQLWALILNLIAHSMIILLVKKEADKFQHPALQYGLLISVTYGMPLVQNAVFLWADSIFIALILLCCTSIQKYITTKNPVNFLFASILAVMAIYERYIGVSLVAACCLQIVLFLDKPIPRRVVEAFVFGLICSMFFILWEYRNYVSTGATNHPYDAGIFSLAENLYSMFAILGTYWIPGNLPSILRFSIVVILIIFSAYHYYSNWSNSNWEKISTKLRYEFLWLSFAGLYIGFFAFLNTLFFICDWDDRYISPCYPFALMLVFKWCDDYLKRFFSSFVISIVVIIMLSYPLIRYFKNAWAWKENGIGFNNINWQNNQLLRWVKSQEDGVYISNNSMPVIIPGNKECYFFPVNLQKPAIAVLWNDEFKLNYIDWKVDALTKYYELSAGPEFPEGKIYYLLPLKTSKNTGVKIQN